MQSRRVLYSGRVQGVGFRYNARRIASRYAVTGFVKNLDDGRVELLAEGPPDQLDGFLAELASSMSDYIRSADMQTLPATATYKSFDITH
jgi:acylphosphatase